MGIVMLVMFYTSRVVLQVLGTDNFGTWNVINSLIISFSFISTPMVTSTQRFLNYDMGKDGKNLEVIFGTSLLLFIIIGSIIIILLESIGLWFLNSKMDFDREAMNTVNVVYQLMIISLTCKILRLPFEATVIAFEKMSFYAIMSVIETFLLLLIVFSLKLFPSYSMLITYGVLYLIVHIIITSSYITYCIKHFNCVSLKIIYHRQYLKQIASFSGWNLIQSIAAMSSTSGLNVVANMFFGVVVNAAYGLTTQLGGAVNQFVASFQRAVNPQMVKSYAAGELKRVQEILYNVSKFSFLLIFAIVLPLYWNIDIVLGIWLGNDIPPFTPIFCKLYLIYILLMCTASLFDYAILATGNIRNYSIIISSCVLLNILFTYIFFKIGYPAYILFIIKCIVEVLILIIRISFLLKRKLISFIEFWKVTLQPCGVICVLSVLYYYYLYHLINTSEGIIYFAFSIMIFILGYSPLCWFLGFSSKQKSIIKNKISSHLKFLK